MSATDLLSQLLDRGITVRVADGKPRVKPQTHLTAEDKGRLQLFKAELLNILGVESKADEVLDPDERQRLMDSCADKCRAAQHGHKIDRTEVDKINAKIGETYSRRELMKLLHQFEAAVTGQPCD